LANEFAKAIHAAIIEPTAMVGQWLFFAQTAIVGGVGTLLSAHRA
jgi:hypothetical protein